MSTPTRPVWALPAIGAGAGTLFSLLGGLNVDDPNVVPSVKAKKLLRTLVLGSAIGLGTEAMLRGGGLAYKGLMSKSSSAMQINRFKHKTLYSLITKSADVAVPDSTTSIPALPLQEATIEESPAVATNPNPGPTAAAPATNQPPAGATTPPPKTTTPPPTTNNKTPSEEPWHTKTTMGIPNGYLGFGLGSLLGAGLLYHLLTEKKKRKPSGYLNAAGAGLLTGLLGYGLYDFSKGGWGTSSGNNNTNNNTDKKYTGKVVDYIAPGANDWRSGVNPEAAGTDAGQIQRDIQVAREALTNQNRLSDNYNNRGLTLNNPSWYTESDNATNSLINGILSDAFNKNPHFNRAITAAVMGPSASEALFDLNTSPRFSKDPIAYNNETKNTARDNLRELVYDLILKNTGSAPEATTVDTTVNNIINSYSQSAESIPFRAQALANDVTAFASWNYALRSNPNNPTISRDPVARQFSYDSAIPHLVYRMGGRQLTNAEFNQLNQLTKQLEIDIARKQEWIAQENYKVPASASINLWSLIQGALTPGDPSENSQNQFAEGIRAVADKQTSEFQQAIQRDQINIKNFFTQVLSTPGNSLPPSTPTDTPTYAPGSPVPTPTGTVATTPLTPDYSTLLTNNPNTPRFNINPDGTVSTFNWSKLLNPTTTIESTETPTTPVPVETPVVPSKVSNTPKPTQIVPAILQNDPAITGSEKQEKQPAPQVQPQENNTSYIDPITGTVVVGTGLGAGAAGLTWGLTPSKTPERTLELYSTPNGNNAWSVENIKTQGTTPAKDELQRLVNLRNGNISPEEYLIPGRSEALENISSRITTNNRGLLGDPATVNYDEVQKLANENITRLEDEIKQVKNYINQEYTSKGIKPPKFIEEKTNARLSKLNAKIKQWGKIGLAGTEIVHTPEEIAAHNAQIKNLNNQIINIKDEALNAPMRPQPEYTKAISDIQEQINTLEKNFNTKRFHTPSEEAILNDIRAIWNGDINIPKAEQEALEALNNRLQQIESFSDLRKANGESIRALKQEAIMDFANKVQEARAGLTGEKSNPIYSQWKQQATDAVNSLKINGERLPWKYRLSTAEIADIADSPLKQAILEKPAVPGMSFKDAVTYLNDPELLKASKQLKDANAHLQEVQRSNQTKIKAGIKPNPLDEVRAQKRIELAQNRIQQLKAQITYGHIYGDSVNPMLKGVPINSNYAPEEMVKLIEKARIPELSRKVTGIPESIISPQIRQKRIVLDQMIDLFGDNLNNPEVKRAFDEFKDATLKAIDYEAKNRSLNQFATVGQKGGLNNPGIEFLNELAADAKAKGDPYLSDIIDTAINNVNKNKGLPVNPISKKPSNIHIVDKPVAKAVSPLKKILAKGLAALTPIDLIRRGVDDATTPYTNNKEKVFSKALDNRSFAEREAQAAYDRAIAQGKSKEEALREANGMFGTSVALGGAWGLVNRIPALAVETVNIPSYLYNLGEEGASLAGLKTDKVPVTDTDKITLYNLLGGDIGGSWGQVGEGIGQGMGNLIPIIGQTAKHIVSRPVELGNNADKIRKAEKIKKHQRDEQYSLYNKLWRQKAYASGFTPDDLETGIGYTDPERIVTVNKLRKLLGAISAKDWDRMTPEAREKAIQSMQLPTPKNNPNKSEYRIPAKNITQDHFNLALSLVGKDDTTKIKALGKLSPFDQNAVLQIINDMENTIQY